VAKILTKEEITQLAEEYAELDRWTQVRDWARKYYGDGATTVEVEIEYQFNDGDPEYPSVESFSVMDKNGKHLPVVDEHDEEYEMREELPVTEDSHAYNLTKQPPISFPVVVVR